MSAPKGNRNRLGGKRANAHRPAGAKARAESAAVTDLIVLLHTRGLSFDQIAGRLWADFGIKLTRAAVWQRHKRGKEGTRETRSGTEGT